LSPDAGHVGEELGVARRDVLPVRQRVVEHFE
jgi:hypothetical protein